MPHVFLGVRRRALAAIPIISIQLLAGPESATSQGPPPPRGDVRLQGVVVDAETYQPVAAATVSLVGTEITVTTGAWGSFALPDAPLGTVVVRVSADGRPSVVENVEVRQGRVAFVQVVLPSIAATLGELLVDVEGQPEVLDDQAQSAADLLALEVPRARANEAMVGERDFQLRLRDGTTLSTDVEPLVVVDGVVMAGPGAYEALLSIPAADVAEIQILKGPAAASSYPNAANGVVVVTTKKGIVRR